ncbi:MAG: DUF4870 domain-containing protein [Chloroflexota bacterium]|nr:MAG: DUF4870 domain-containing protein [Chloroflexota bacterium]
MAAEKKDNKPAQAKDTSKEKELTNQETIDQVEQLPPPAEEALSPSNEQNWAMISHLSILLNLFTGFLGPVVAFIIYLVYRDRSRYIAYQSLQSTVFQLVTWIGVGLLIGAMWLLNLLLTIVLVGIFCFPFTILGTIFLLIVPLASLVYGIYAAVQCSQGDDFRYWLVGDWVRGTYENI